jgi:hypothetical protein
MQNIENPGLNTLLTPKELLGYSFEMRGQKLLAKLGITFNGNPVDPMAWKINISHGCDICARALFMFCKLLQGEWWRGNLWVRTALRIIV